MKRISMFGVLLLLLAACSSASAQNSTAPVNTASDSSNAGAQTYTVLVGAHDSTANADLEAYLPADVTVHVGDTVTWKLNSKEIHTVTFLGSEKTPDLLVPVPNSPQGAMMFNPQVAFPVAPKDGQFDGSTYANSGIMGPDQGQYTDFSLTFNKAGTYSYLCVVHGEEKMVGKITVVDASAQIPSPAEVQAQGQKELQALVAQVPAIQQAAEAEVKSPQKNSDGTTTYYVEVGYSQGQVDLESFFPNTLNVQPGDTIVWTFSQQDIAPHTITFLNGAEEPALVIPKPQQSGPPLLTLNPEVAAPQNAGKPLTTTGIYSSGIIDPSAPGPHSYALKIGDVSGTIPYICMLHEENGMKGSITVSAASSK
ncbi:MAG: plastocyanin/azurin family copper-binding protein [Anaerolineales bacterium]|jgi:plastocyanin